MKIAIVYTLDDTDNDSVLAQVAALLHAVPREDDPQIAPTAIEPVAHAPAEAREQVTDVGSRWHPDEVGNVLQDLLRAGAWVQRAVLEEALAGNGFVTRGRIYEIGGFAPDRLLKGFAKPVHTTIKKLIGRGKLGDRPRDDLLTVVLEANKAVGYQVPSYLTKGHGRVSAA